MRDSTQHLVSGAFYFLLLSLGHSRRHGAHCLCVMVLPSQFRYGRNGNSRALAACAFCRLVRVTCMLMRPYSCALRDAPPSLLNTKILLDVCRKLGSNHFCERPVW